MKNHDTDQTSAKEKPDTGSPTPSCSPPVVLVVPLDTSDECVAELRNAGYLAVKTDKPDAVRIVTVGGGFNANDLTMAIMHGLNQTHPGSDGLHAARFMRSAMVAELFRRMQAREAAAIEENPKDHQRGASDASDCSTTNPDKP